MIRRLSLLIGPCLLAACVQTPKEEYLEASVLLSPQGPFQASGVARLREVPGGVLIEISVLGAPPGEHGVHIQEDGSCYGMGSGHLNPERRKHGQPQVADSHAGDLGNLDVSREGIGELEVFAPFVSLRSGPNSAVGKALVVRERRDDMRTQPHGGAGSIMTCGVVALDRRKTNRERDARSANPVVSASAADTDLE